MKTIAKHLIPNGGVLILAGLLLLVQGVSARQEPAPAQPQMVAKSTISYQGNLTDENGNPVDETVSMEFALYDSSTSNDPSNRRWGPETQTVNVSNGLFHVLLGGISPLNPLNLTGDLWLDIRVNGEQLTPREQLTGVLNALNGIGTPLVINGYLRVSQSPDPQNGGVLQLMNATSGNVWTIPIQANDNDKLGFFFYDANSQAWFKPMTLDRDGNAWVSNRLTIGPGTLAEPLQVKSSWSVLGLDTLAVGQDAGVRFYENGVAQWFLLNDASEGNRLHLGSNGAVAFTLSQYGDMDLYRSLNLAGGSLTASGSGSFGGATFAHGQVNIQSPNVPLAFRESDQVGAGSLWRMPLDGTSLRFDSSDNGIDFPDNEFHTPLILHSDGSMTCGALTEANLQTAEERTAGRSDRFEEGDVLCWSARAQRLEKCSTPSDPLIQAVADKGGRPIVIGAEVVKVIGPVRAGDYLTASSMPGYAMASATPTFGIVIAQALEDFDGEQGIIKAMIRKM